MYTRVLYPTDGSDPAREALGYALDLAAEHDATLHVLNVANTNQDSLTTVEGRVVDVLESEGEEVVDEAVDRATERGVDAVSAVLQGDPALTIVDYAREYDVDLVVMPTHGRSGLSRLLLGSVTERVVGSIDVPLVVVNPTEDRTFRYPPREILAATDGSGAADLALDSAVALARDTGATLHVVYVVETTTLGFDVRSALASEELDAGAESVLEAAAERAEESGVDPVTHVEHGHPHREILSLVDGEVDLLALGVHGETDFSRSVLGGVATKVIRTAPVPVLLRRESDSAV
ncbi:universal stress protein [Salinigranum rubrum]|uniref:Universal stress protein n=1 Tax=Salinigranum rubrum TaxID=755307 RepID=A0A2I8VF21_9EURY|nr:universal stress protein [Salinigranum rubrum]AUV80530.1 universal stress protein [Salinigranum rubrum]